jgi:hypothetical protein
LQNPDKIPTLRDISREANEICALLGHYTGYGGNGPERLQEITTTRYAVSQKTAYFIPTS